VSRPGARESPISAYEHGVATRTSERLVSYFRQSVLINFPHAGRVLFVCGQAFTAGADDELDGAGPALPEADALGTPTGSAEG
jgi:hypothetical protein